AMAVMFLSLCIVHLIRKWRGPVASVSDAMISYGSAAVGALTFMVTDSHWFNAVEAEVYSVSTFLTAFVVWLILRWSQKDEAKSHVRYILLLAYVLGLASGIHLLNLLTLPFVALVIYFRRREFTWPGFGTVIGLTAFIFWVIYKGVIKGLPQLADLFNVYAVVLVTVILLAGTAWVIQQRLKNSSIILTSLVLIMVGYSTYATIFIRSHHDPAIDENDPETTQSAVSYLEREQYGDWSITDRARWTPETQSRYSGVADFVWNYQFRKMYLRYFLWQFAGRGPSTAPGVSPVGALPNEDGVNWFQFGLPLALLLGLYGMGYHMQRDWKHGLAVLSLFVVTGLLVILYLNQPDPQPRERDYSYVGSFFAWSIWIGIGVAGVLESLARRLKGASIKRVALPTALVILFLAMPGMMVRASYHQHDRTGNYVAWDYSYNLLNSCAENGILFTNGDNDTFPLWYLQEVEGIRKDVRVVNLSLLNTAWYIRQLRDAEPKLPLFLTDEGIAQMRPIPWEERELSLPAPGPDNTTVALTWTLKPTYADRFIRTQDRMIVQLIKDGNWSRPIYFAVTVAPSNKIGLERYLEMQGLVYELMPEPVNPINIEKLHHNLMEVYQYRNLDDPSIYYNSNIRRLLQNLRASFLQLALDSVMKNDHERGRMYLDALAAAIPESVISVDNKELYLQIGQMYAEVGVDSQLRERLEDLPQRFPLTARDSLSMGSLYSQQLDDWETADGILKDLAAHHPTDGNVVGGIVRIYRQAGHADDAVAVLRNWLNLYPGDQSATNLLQTIQNE
ncbi:MAG: DUF2723 domain-containing protein, partial [Candidatus Marinimicrobia bacterium]|nr:DUF2723 domain-containing protein [Candidatus Neomarinimicrobiota bacterium]